MKKIYDEDNIIKTLRDYIVSKRNYRDINISQSSVSEVTGLSKSHITKALRCRYDCNFYDFVNKYRTYYAQKLLKSHQHQYDSLEEIALQCGFSCRMTFYRSYKKIYGITPGEERKKLTSQ